MQNDGSVTLEARLDTSDIQKGTNRIRASLSEIQGADKKLDWSGMKGGTSASSLLDKTLGAAKKGMSALGSAAVTMGKVGIGAIGGMTAAIGGLAISGGVARAMAIGDAQAKMNQLGMDTNRIMDSVKASVSGTRFALNEAATSAVTLGSAGVAAGEDMTQALKSIASTASISGAEFSDIGAIYSKVAASGKLSTEVMNQLLERGVSVTAALSKKLGVTQDKVREMVTNGEIDFRTFSEAMQEYLGNAADSANSTFSGAMANVRAALSRVGAAFANPVLEAGRKLFVALIPAIDACAKALQPMVDSFTELVQAGGDSLIPLITGFTDALQDGQSPIESFTDLLSGLAVAMTDILAQALKMVANVLVVVINALASALPQIIPTLVSALVAVVRALIPAIVELVPVLIDAAFQLFTGLMEGLNQVAPALLNALPVLIDKVVLAITSNVPVLLAAIVELVFTLANGLIREAPRILSAAFRLFQGLVDALIDIIPVIIEELPTLIEEICAFITEAYPIFVESMVTFWMSLIDAIVEILPMLIETLTEMIPLIIETLIAQLPVLVEGAITLFHALIDALVLIIPMLVEMLPELIVSVTIALLEQLPTLLSAAVTLFTALLDAFVQIIPMLIPLIPKLIISFASALIDHLPEILSAGFDLFFALLDAFIEFIPSLIAAVPGMIIRMGAALIENAPKLVAKMGELLGKLIMKVGEWIANDLVPSIIAIPGKIAENFKFPKIPLPHFKATGKVDLTVFPPKLPSIGIDWYAKGGIFNSASVIGVGEAGPEAVVPLNGSRMQPFADAVADGIGAKGAGDITVNINIENFVNSSLEDFDELVDRLTRDIQRRLDYQMRAKGLSV